MEPAAPPVWVVGGTGYSGLEAVRLLGRHPGFRLAHVIASPGAGERDLSGIDPLFAPGAIRSVPLSPNLLEEPPAAALLALPDDAAAGLAADLLERGVRVVDLSGAFRIREASHYPAHCGFEHPKPALLAEAVYGLSEWQRQHIASARLVANPGCYPTATLLALLPLERAGLIDPQSPVVVDGKSGATGAGRRLEAAYLFAEANGNCRPYSVLDHRHAPEIAQALGFGPERPVWFAPHVLPLSRGLMTTLYLRLRRGVGGPDITAALSGSYRSSPFVRLLGEQKWPEIRGVVRTNRCDIGWTVANGAAVVVSAIDNLMKGAAGQAIQNLNLMFGREETEGLPS